MTRNHPVRHFLLDWDPHQGSYHLNYVGDYIEMTDKFLVIFLIILWSVPQKVPIVALSIFQMMITFQTWHWQNYKTTTKTGWQQEQQHEYKNLTTTRKPKVWQHSNMVKTTIKKQQKKHANKIIRIKRHQEQDYNNCSTTMTTTWHDSTNNNMTTPPTIRK